jgi:hypothetical protein
MMQVPAKAATQKAGGVYLRSARRSQPFALSWPDILRSWLSAEEQVDPRCSSVHFV